MRLDDVTFPIVRMHYNEAAPGGTEAGFELFEALLAREQPFVLLGFSADAGHMQTHEQRKQLTLWMKRNRESLHRFVKAMVYIEPQPANRFVAKAISSVFSKSWGYPMLVAASEADAILIAERLLNGEAPSSIGI